MIFAMLSYCGFDVISTLAEEAKLPKKLIPQATFVSLIFFGALIITGVWALTYAEPVERIKALTDAGGMPITEIARKFWGKGAVLVTITGISAAFGIAIATSVGASRVLFSMGRSGQTWAGFAKLHPGHRVPWNAMHAIFLGGLVGSVLTGFFVGPYNAYLWWGTTSTFFGMLTFIFVNLANLILFRALIFRSPKGFVLHGLLPVFGIGAGSVHPGPLVLPRPLVAGLGHRQERGALRRGLRGGGLLRGAGLADAGAGSTLRSGETAESTT